jgi:hypothetical protein
LPVGTASTGSPPASSHLTPLRRSPSSGNRAVSGVAQIALCRSTSLRVASRTEKSGRCLSGQRRVPGDDRRWHRRIPGSRVLMQDRPARAGEQLGVEPAAPEDRQASRIARSRGSATRLSLGGVADVRGRRVLGGRDLAGLPDGGTSRSKGDGSLVGVPPRRPGILDARHQLRRGSVGFRRRRAGSSIRGIRGITESWRIGRSEGWHTRRDRRGSRAFPCPDPRRRARACWNSGCPRRAACPRVTG